MQPDATILDLRMPEMNGIEAALEILKRVHTKVLILTIYDYAQLIRECMKAGVRGYMMKADAGWDLVSTIQRLRRNKSFCSPTVAEMILDGFGAKQNEKDTTRKNKSRLTKRQRQICS